MDQHPPTEQGAVGKRPWPGRTTLIIVGCVVCCIALLTIALVLQAIPATLYARSPSIAADPTGILIAFDEGQWSNAVVELNGAYTCVVGSLGPGRHVLAWNRFQGGGAAPALSTLKTITLRGEVDGKQRAIDFTVTVGPGYVATSSVTIED